MRVRTKITWMALLAVLAGCGTTKNKTATQQRLVSDAVDQAVGNIDFRPLAGQKVFFDTRYMAEVKDLGFVNANYVVSSLRQQMVAAQLLLQDQVEDADFIVEGRVGVVATDSNEVVYGMPANNGVSAAASLMPNAPPIPTIPEISLARKNTELGAAKVALFAYHRATRLPVWQSGISRGKTTAQDMWLVGAGPFQSGSIYNGPQFAGQRIRLPALNNGVEVDHGPAVPYDEEYVFRGNLNAARVAERAPSSLPADLLESLPSASEEWLTPLEPSATTPLDRLWR
jgi:hypothetical protein